MSYKEILELWEERAAIREYLGGYERKEAEQLAWKDIRNDKKIMENIQNTKMAQKNVS